MFSSNWLIDSLALRVTVCALILYGVQLLLCFKADNKVIKLLPAIVPAYYGLVLFGVYANSPRNVYAGNVLKDPEQFAEQLSAHLGIILPFLASVILAWIAYSVIRSGLCPDNPAGG